MVWAFAADAKNNIPIRVMIFIVSLLVYLCECHANLSKTHAALRSSLEFDFISCRYLEYSLVRELKCCRGCGRSV